MATSDPPQSIDDTQTHGPEAGQQSAGGADQNGEDKSHRQRGDGQEQRGQEAIELGTDNGNGHNRQTEPDQSSNQRNHQRLPQYKEEDKAVRESDSLEHREFAGAFANRYSHRVARNQQQREENH